MKKKKWRTKWWNTPTTEDPAGDQKEESVEKGDGAVEKTGDAEPETGVKDDSSKVPSPPVHKGPKGKGRGKGKHKGKFKGKGKGKSKTTSNRTQSQNAMWGLARKWWQKERARSGRHR